MPCHHIISDRDIEKIYKITQISRYKISIECHDKNIKTLKIDIYSDSDRMNLGSITREYHIDYELRGIETSEMGKVALHQTFFLKESYQKKNIARSLFDQEITIYANNEFNEIHLDAIEDGVIVWRSLGYKYLDESTEENLMIRWYEYFHTIFSDIPENERMFIMNKTKVFADIIGKYKSPKERISFPEWLRKTKLVTAEPMFYILSNKGGNNGQKI